jgi:hypothetical protein
MNRKSVLASDGQTRQGVLSWRLASALRELQVNCGSTWIGREEPPIISSRNLATPSEDGDRATTSEDIRG